MLAASSCMKKGAYIVENEQFPAHIRFDPISGMRTTETNAQHSRKTAEYARTALDDVGLGGAAYLSGLTHDMGKENVRYAQYINRAASGESVRRGSVNHSFAGARYILRRWHEGNGSTLEDVAAELLAFSAGAHHGLFDCVGPQQQSGFERRINEDNRDIDEAIENFLRLCVSEQELDSLFSEAFKEFKSLFDRLLEIKSTNADMSFYVGMTARLLLSAVIEGDRRDTAEFMSGVSRDELPEDMRPVWHLCLCRLEERLKAFSPEGKLTDARQKISSLCRSFAEREGGIYRLSVPTGGGKTLSGLRYALAHAEAYNKRRIVFVSPLLTILDQNAQVIRNYIQDDSLILEHHSNIVQPGDADEARKRELLSENWDAPIVITTFYQLLNTMFSGKTSAVRRFWSLCGSVIIIDEVQSLPMRMLSQFNMTLNFLTEFCGATVVLCSATQPCLEAADHPFLKTPEEIVPHEAELWRRFRRTELCNAGHMLLAEIPGFASDLLENCDSLLIVCNKKDEAEYLYRELRDKADYCAHLSAAMCPAHRKKALNQLQQALQYRNEKTVCVSTQVIEAGVDISFGCVIRLCAGMDNIVQTAGRCNRNGESDQPGKVYLIDCVDENLTALPDILHAKETTIELLTRFSRQSARFDGDLSSDRSIDWYYRRLYSGSASGFQDYALPPPDNRLTQYSLLSDNASLADPAICPEAQNYFMRQAFKLAGDSFRVYENETIDVLVPYGDGKQLICDLNSERAKWDIDYAKQLLSKAKEYSISLYEYQRKQLEQMNGMGQLLDGAVLSLGEGYYDDMTGFTLHDNSNGYVEV